MKEWKVILATLVIFGAGIGTGALVANLSKRPTLRPVNTAQPARFPAPDQRHEYLRQINRKLDLTPEQHERIEQIIRESQMRTKTLWDSVMPKMNEELKKTREQIREQLTAPQRQQFDEFSKPRPPRRPEEFWRDPRPPGAEKNRPQPPAGPPGAAPSEPPPGF